MKICGGCAALKVADAGLRIIDTPLTSADELFAAFEGSRKFLGCFGWNWNAFEECINDLHWAPWSDAILIIRSALALPSESTEIFYDMLSDIADRTHRPCARLVVLIDA